MFDQHFLKHPIATFDRRNGGAGTLADLSLDTTVAGDLNEPFVPALPKRPSRQDIRAEVEPAMTYERMPPPMPAAQ